MTAQQGSIPDMEALVQQVVVAASAWRGATVHERLAVVRQAGALLHARHDELMACLQREGFPAGLAEYYGGWILRQASAEVLAHAARELVRDTPSGSETLVRRPDGVVALMTPGSSPTVSTAPLFSILLAGNGVLLRIPGQVGGARLIAEGCVGEALERAGYSRALASIVAGKNRDLLDPLYAAAGIDTIVFFGNSQMGAVVAEQGHAAGKKVVLELDANDCMIVWADADLDAALASAVHGFDFSSQPCAVPKHFLVHPAIAEAFTAGLCARAQALRTIAADPERGVLMPLLRPDSFVRSVAEAAEHGEVRTGGHWTDAKGERVTSGLFPAATVAVLDHCEELAQSPLFHEEIFAPVLPVVRFAGDDDQILGAMIELVRATPYGLRASIWTASEPIATHFVRAMGHMGLVIVNGDHAQHPAFLSPWGGPRRTGGPYGESNLFWQKTSRLQGVVAPPQVVRAALRGRGDDVGLEIEDRIATITLRPPTPDGGVARVAELVDVLDEVAGRAATLRGVVLTAAGPSAFVGLEARAWRRLDPHAARRVLAALDGALLSLERLPLPTLAVVDGECRGRAFELVLHCDRVLAGTDARFGLSDGSPLPSGSAMGRLARYVGPQRAAAWLADGVVVAVGDDLARGLEPWACTGPLGDGVARWCADQRARAPAPDLAVSRLRGLGPA